MKHFFLAAFLTMALGTSLAAYAQTGMDPAALEEAVRKNALRQTPVYTAMTEAARNGAAEVEKIVQEVQPKASIEERDALMLWLADRTFGRISPETFNLFYFRLYSEARTRQAFLASQLGRAAEQSETAAVALRALMVYELAALADAERCGAAAVTDSVVTAVIKDVVDRFNALSFAMKSVSKEAYDLHALDAVDIEERTGMRPLNVNLCMMGEGAKIDPATFKPGEPPPHWNEKRVELRRTYKNKWTERYYALHKR